MTFESQGISGTGRRRILYHNLFPAIVKCAHCLGKMDLVIAAKKGRPVYRRTGENTKLRYVAGRNIMYLVCGNARRLLQADRNHSSGCANRGRVRYERLEPVILDHVLPMALGIPDLTRSAHAYQLRSAILQADSQLKSKRDRLAEMMRRQAAADEFLIQELARFIEYDERALMSLNSELDRIDGQTGWPTHHTLVHKARAALTDPDDDVRIPARKRTIEALGQVINIVLCDSSKVSTVVLDGGRVTIRIDGSGNFLERVEAANRPELMRILSQQVDDNDQSLSAVMRRLAILQSQRDIPSLRNGPTIRG